MSKELREDWRELCSAVIEAEDPDELLKLVIKLNQILECDEPGRCDSVMEGETIHTGEERPC
jgi:hypothetical protein